mmetsp:Transcript_38723/g.109499  ORF Transcript_38723/g.109499 Transcript_38723/m.109499 type:complete len:87 (-) Transcript_38723:161-421(-)
MAADPKYQDKVTFLLVNLDGVDKAKQYSSAKGLTVTGIHGYANAGDAYGVQYIPHKVIIGKDGKVVANYKTKEGGSVKFPDVDAIM